MTISSWGALAIPIVVVVIALFVPAPFSPSPMINLAVHGRLDELESQSANTSLKDIRDLKGNTLLHWAAKAGQVDVCRYLLDHNVDHLASNNAGTTALHWAVYSPEHGSEIIKMLIEAGVDPNVVNANRESPLHWAVDWDRPNSVETLLRNGADPNLVDQHKDTPLHRIQRDCTESSSCATSLKLLLKYGVNAAAVNEYGRFALTHIDWDYNGAQQNAA